jgi:hypothetical protein
LQAKQESEFLIALAVHLDDFIARLFGIETEVRELSARHYELAPLYSCKRLFVQRKAVNTYKAAAAAEFDGARLEAQLVSWFDAGFSELEFARQVMAWLKDEGAHADKLDVALRYAAWAVHTPQGTAQASSGRAVQDTPETRLSAPGAGANSSLRTASRSTRSPTFAGAMALR